MLKLIKAFCQENKLVVISAIILFFLCYGFEITNPTLSIDEEGALYGGSSFNAWLTQGRLGIAVFKALFHSYGLMPLYLSSFMSAALWTLSALVWCAVLFYGENDSYRPDALSLIIFCGFYMSMPLVIAEFMIFATYNIEVSLAMICCAASVYYIKQYNTNRNKKHFIFAILLLTFAIAVYQAFVTVFITGVIAVLICSLFEKNNFETSDFVKWLRTIPSYAIALIISIVGYYALLYAFLAIFNLQSSAYLNTFVGWGTGESFVAILRNTVVQIIIRYFTPGLVGSFEVIATFVALGVLLILCLFYFRGLKRLVVSCLCLALGFSPFIMNFALMGYVPLRAMQVLPLMMGLTWFFLYKIIKQFTTKEIAIVIPCIVSLLLIFGQIQTLNKLFYGDYVRYKMDKQVAAMVMYDLIHEFNGMPKTPVMFLGTYHHAYNPLVIPLEVIGGSFWNWDDSDNGRITAFLHMEGYYITPSRMNKREMEAKYRQQMPIWPEGGSIAETEDGIMIRLS